MEKAFFPYGSGHESRGAQDPWQLLNENPWLLTELARFLRTLRVSEQDAEDVLQAFVLDRLPRLSSRLDALPASARISYLRTVLRNFVTDIRRAAAREDRALSSFASAPPHMAQNQDSGITEKDLAFEQIAEPRASYVRSFLGIDGPEMSLRQIASNVGSSRHAVRSEIIDGLLALALRAGQSGALTPLETNVCELILLSGESVESAAATLGVTTAQARHALNNARRVIARSLRNRRDVS